MEIEILIVGAGPVGLNLAVCLSKLGIKYRIIDKRSGLNTTSNAIGVNPRTLEIWETLGFVNDALECGVKLNLASWYDSGKFLSSAAFSHVESKYKFMLALPQAQTEALLASQLNKLGVAIEWDTTLIDITDNGTGVTAKCNTADREEIVAAKYIIGCDGYHSSVRDLTKIERACHDLTQHFIMVDAQLNGSIATDQMSVNFHDDGILFFFPMQGSMRVVAEISNDPVYSSVKIGDTEIFDAILDKRMPGISIKHIDWASSFYVHECLANQYYKNRVILCGDAAHTHSPAGGQGMNTGIQDTWNLAWKLAHILKNQASDKLLETYHIERHAIGHDVLNRSGKITAIGATNNKVLQALRNFGISHLVGLDTIASKFVNSIAQTDICYAKTKLVQAKQVLQHAKTRYQLDAIEWVLMSKENLEQQKLPKFIRFTRVPDLANNTKFCLIRPDGYVALYAETINEVIDFLKLNDFQF